MQKFQIIIANCNKSILETALASKGFVAEFGYGGLNKTRVEIALKSGKDLTGQDIFALGFLVGEMITNATHNNND